MTPELRQFSTIKAGDHIQFISGYYETGTVTNVIGTHNGMKMIVFQDDDRDIDRIISYAAHRQVILHVDDEH